MKELKFRARIKESGKPFLFYQEDQYLISFLRRVTSFMAYEKLGDETYDEYNGGRHESYLDKPIHAVLDRFTGRHDEDDKEIYFGDIVKGVYSCVKEDHEFTGLVVEGDYGAIYVDCGSVMIQLEEVEQHGKVKVVGNSFENAGILEL